MSPNFSTRIVAERKSGCRNLQWLGITLIAFCMAFCCACGNLAQGFNPATTSAANTKPSHAMLVISGTFAPAVQGKAYSTVLSVMGGSAPYTFSVTDGSLPQGLMLNKLTGGISGIPFQSGTFKFTIMASSHLRESIGEKPFSLVVEPQSGAHAIVVVTPSAATVVSGGKLQFAATVQNASNPAVRWSASAGRISNLGLFTSPSVTTVRSVVVTATSSADPSAKGSVTISVTSTSRSLVVLNSALAGARLGVPYSASVVAQGGTPPYRWMLSQGSLPGGLSLNGNTGVISGVASQSGILSFSVEVMDAASHNTTQAYTLDVSPPSTSNYDGPAELPRLYVQSTVSDTPTSGNIINVNAGGDFQSAINSANCGDTIQLQAGATFSGQFTLPAKSCDDAHWIVIRTSAPDSALPPEGTRLTPCFAGVASLPARPSFHCTSTNNVTAKVALNATHVSGPIIFASGANHYRLLGLELTRPAGGGIVFALAAMQDGGPTHHIVLDRVWIHGTPQDETMRGIDFSGSSNVAVVDSTFTDFHCVAISGSCTDSQSILGGVANLPMGPYKIVNNFLEASGEVILFGGGAATETPTDIEIRRNHFFKPRIWQPGQPGFVGGSNGNAFIAKNLFELKNAQRVLFEGNVMEYSWGGFTQEGFGILLTPKNQFGRCPTCQVTDVTVRYSTISHVAAGFSVSNSPTDNGDAPLAGERFSIHDVVVDDIDGTAYNGPGLFAKVGTALVGAPLLKDVSFNHITAFAPQFLLWVSSPSNSPMSNISVTNSIENAGAYSVKTTGGGSANCAYSNVPITIVAACFNPGVFTANAIIAVGTTAPPSVWPAGNHFPSDASAVKFVNYNGGNGGDYHLSLDSPYKNGGMDGKDLGADVDSVSAATAGVY